MPEVQPLDTSSNGGAALAASMKPSPSPVIGAIEKELPGALVESKANAEQQKQLAGDTVARLDKDQRARADLSAPLPPAPSHAPEAQNTNPAQAWGSVAMSLAMIGSAFTRQPLLNALNAGAEVMKAYKANDVAATKANFEKWKAENEYASKLYEYQRDAYKDAIASIDSDQSGALAKLRVLSAALKDDPMARLADAGNIAGVVTLDQQRRDGHTKLVAETAKLQQQNEVVQQVMTATQAVQEARKSGDPNAIAAAEQQLRDAQEAAKAFNTAEGKGVGAADTRMAQEDDLLKRLTKEYDDDPNNADKPRTATVDAALRAKAHGSAAGRVETPAQADAAENKAAVDAADAKFKAAHPDATPTEIAENHRKEVLKSKREMSTATKPPRSAEAMAVAKYLEERPDAGSKDITKFIAKERAANAVERAFAAGPEGRKITSLNTVADHALLLEEYADALKNHESPIRLNQLINRYALETGQPEITSFELAKNFFTAEVMAVLAQNAGTGHERDELKTQLDAMQSPEQLHQGIDTAGRFVTGRLHGFQQQYARNDKEREDYFQKDMLTEGAQHWFKKFEGRMPGYAVKPAVGSETFTHAKDAIKAGAPRDAVRQKYIELGGDGAAFDKEVPR